MTDCPRCGLPITRALRAPFGTGVPAVSRTDDRTKVCEPCGTEEAIRQANGELQRQDEWPVEPLIVTT